jgi:nucleotide-binding universal stress UspA family protein
MSKRILVATDLSAASEDALRQAASYTGSTLGVIHVMPNLVDVRPLFPQNTEANAVHAVEIEAKVRGALEDAAKAVTAGPVEVFVAQGLDHEAVIAQAKKWKADLLVVGSHGRTGIPRLLLGSVAEQLVRAAPCSVLVARKHRPGPVLVATDLSPASLPAVAVGAQEAKRRGVSLVVAHVIDHALSDFATSALSQFLGVLPPGNVDLLAEAREAAKDALTATVERTGVPGDVQVLEGSAASAIIRAATSLGAELIVVGAHGRTGVRDLVLGTVTERILRSAESSVFVVRQ